MQIREPKNKIALIREPGNFITHVIPAILALPALALLVSKSKDQLSLLAAGLYGLGILALFAVSTIYHSVPKTPDAIRFWQKLDHCCIYVMIAGSFSPTALLFFEGTLRWAIFSLVWLFALSGCILKLFNRLQKGLLSTALYIVMGCLILPFLHKLIGILPNAAIFWLIAGGLCYVGGTYFYTKDKPMGRYVHSHEIWHVFVNFGALAHFIYNFVYIF